MIKLIATDMDGTFLDEKGQYDVLRFKKLLDYLTASGVRFAVASGRSYVTLTHLFHDFLDQLIFVGENGAVVVESGQVQFEMAMPSSFYLDLVNQLDQSGRLSKNELLLSGRKGGYLLKTAAPAYQAFIRHYYVNIQFVADFSEIDDEVFKITAKLDHENMTEDVAWLNQHLSAVSVMTTGFSSIDITLKGVDKRTGLAHLCQQLDIKPEEVMVFGDNLNDYQMMQFAGQALATANARDEIKAIATQVIGHCNDSAVLNYLEEIYEQN